MHSNILYPLIPQSKFISFLSEYEFLGPIWPLVLDKMQTCHKIFLFCHFIFPLSNVLIWLSNIFGIFLCVQWDLCDNFKLYSHSFHLLDICCVQGPVSRCMTAPSLKHCLGCYWSQWRQDVEWLTAPASHCLGLLSCSTACLACDFEQSYLLYALVLLSLKVALPCRIIENFHWSKMWEGFSAWHMIILVYYYIIISSNSSSSSSTDSGRWYFLPSWFL